MCYLKFDSRHMKPYQERLVEAHHASNLLRLFDIVVDKSLNSFKTTVKFCLRMEEEWWEDVLVSGKEGEKTESSLAAFILLLFGGLGFFISTECFCHSDAP